MNRFKATVSATAAITFTAAAGVGAIVIATPLIFRGSYNYFRGINGMDDFDVADWDNAVKLSVNTNLKSNKVHTSV